MNPAEANLAAALADWRAALGAAHVRADAATLAAYQNNVGGLPRAIPAVLLPGSTAEVQAVVQIANRHLVPLYPLSRGRNWGLGSRLPGRDGVVIVDLARLNRIRDINVAGQYAVIEPGVTQGQLYDHLQAHHLPLLLNVTGASRDTSLIGNALERGIGYFSTRAHSLSGLEIVLGNGEILRTGFSHMAGVKTAYGYRHGIGPELDGLFAQSNYGIVTSAGFELMPKPAAAMAVIAKIKRSDQLAAFVEALADLRRRDVVRSVWHIGNRERTQIALGPLVFGQLRQRDPAGDGAALRARAEALIAAAGFGPWSAVCGIPGSAGELRLARRAIRQALRGLAEVLFITDSLLTTADTLSRPLDFIPWVRDQRIMLHAVRPLADLARGIPTDGPMQSVWWPLGELPEHTSDDPDQSHCGMLFCVPFLPPDGQCAKEAMDLTYQVYAKHGFTPFVTLNLVDSRALECVINNAFDRRQPDRVAAAHACNDELTAEFIRRGYPPYRIGPQNTPLVVDAGDVFWQTVRDLKRVLDPNHIIAPGRYNLV
jgi:4-cresol dehydrogenase (hydroxylating)